MSKRRRTGNRTSRPASRAPAGIGAAFGPPRRAAPHPQARDAARAARRGDARGAGADRDVLDLRQCRYARSLHHLRRRAARLDGAGRRRVGRRSLGTGAGRRDARALSRARRRPFAARRRRPSRLNLPALVARIAKGEVSELILAVNATVEGQTTAHYIIDLLADYPVKVTRLAHGVPVGGELDYLDDGTLAAAMRQRTAF